jgi:hypothetical protein
MKGCSPLILMAEFSFIEGRRVSIQWPGRGDMRQEMFAFPELML